MRKPLLCLKTKPKLKLNSCCFSFQWQFDLARKPKLNEIFSIKTWMVHVQYMNITD